jgi:Zn-dependent protease
MPIALLTIIVLLISVIFHECSHGWVAYKLGDTTAKNAGRLTLNPLAHLDPVGSILLPLLLIYLKSPFIIGWAKPVPYNPRNLRDQKYGDLKVALGGPGTNFILALVFGSIARFMALPELLKQKLVFGYLQGNYDFLLGKMQGSLLVSIFAVVIIFCFVNLLLMFFNLIPVPPLDGSKVFLTFLPQDWKVRMHQIEPFGLVIILSLLMLGLFRYILRFTLFLFFSIIGLTKNLS